MALFFSSAFNVKLSRLRSFQLDASASLNPHLFVRLFVSFNTDETIRGSNRLLFFLFSFSFFRRIRSYHLKNGTTFVRKRIVSFRLTDVTDLTKLRGKLQVQLPVLAETIEGHNPALSATELQSTMIDKRNQ